MADQDAQDINQMMSATSDVQIGSPKKSMFLWVVLACVVVGVGLGILVYQQSVKTAVKPSPTPRPSAIVAKPSMIPSPIPSAIVPQTNVITPVTNTVTFPEAGKIRVYNDLNNIQLVLTITISGVKNTLTIPNKANTASAPMHSADSTFEVKAGDVGTIEAHLNSVTGPKMGGWILPGAGDTCGANGAGVVNMTPKLTWVLSQFPTGRPVYAKQCWADDIDPKDPSSYDFNDFFLVWGYASTATTSSASPVASTVTSPSPSASAQVLVSPSPSVKASATASASGSASPSPRTVMPDTEDGVPVTGVFEVTVASVSIGLLLLILGIFGLLVI